MKTTQHQSVLRPPKLAVFAVAVFVAITCIQAAVANIPSRTCVRNALPSAHAMAWGGDFTDSRQYRGLFTNSPLVLSHYYDPQVEFLEIGLTINGTTTWKTYGPDLNGVYGAQQGLGGLETLRTGSETVGVIHDGFGNVLGSAQNGSVTWNTAHVTLYGPAEGYPALSLSAGPLSAEHLAYRGKWRDEAGFYYWGARPYDSDRRAFLSFDPLGRGATPDGYAAFNGRPSDLWDPDGRLGKGTYLDLNTLQQFTAYDEFYVGSGAAMAGERANWSFDTPMTDWPSDTLNGQSFRMVFGNEAAGFAEFGMAMGTGPLGIPAEIADAFYQAGTASVGGSGGEQAFAYTRASASMVMAAMAAEVPARGLANSYYEFAATPAKLHGNSLSATGPHDVYVIRDTTTGRIYHFGETGRGFETRGAEWVRKLRNEYGLDTVVEPLRTVEGKAAAKALETRYIETYEKVFGIKPGYVDDAGNFIQIQKGRH